MAFTFLSHRTSFLLTAGALLLAACGKDVPLYDFPREMCGGTAVQGAPSASKTDAPSVTYAASDGTRVFWVEDDYNFRDAPRGVVNAGPLSGGEAQQLATDPRLPQQLVVDEEQVFWSGATVEGAASGIKAVDKQGGAARVVAAIEELPLKVVNGLRESACRTNPATNNYCPYAMAVDATDVYFGPNNTLRKVDKRQPSSVPVVLAHGHVGSIAVDATDVYWLHCTDDSGSTVVEKLSKHGGPVVDLTTVSAKFDCSNGVVDTTIDRIALDDTTVYWATGGLVYSVPKAGGATRTISDGQFHARNVALSGDSVFWITYAHHSLVRAPKSGGVATDLVPTRDDMLGYNDDSCDPQRVATDSKNLFWIVNGGVMTKPL